MSYASQRPPRGISLIEALVAMAVMAFGMIGVVGMQATLRANADLSKQRTEAMRIAQERMEELRNFSVLSTTAGAKAFADKATVGATAVAGYTTNTTYTVSATVTAAGAAPHQQKDLAVDVAWTDRAGTAQNVRLMSTMANIAPELAASLVVSVQGAGGTREPEGRRRGIPPQAKNFGDGTSGFVPPGGTGVGWRFDNVTGLISSVCTTAVTDNATLVLTDFAACATTQKYQLIWGFIRFDLTNPPTDVSLRGANDDMPGTVQAEVIQTAPAALPAPVCLHGYANAALIETPPFKLAAFFCPVPVISTSTPTFAWSGTLQVQPASMPVANPLSAAGTYATDAATANRKVCRLRAAGTYADVTEPLGNQNMFVIRAGDGTTPNVCPTTVPPTYFGHQPTPP